MDIATLSAALSIMKSMPDNAAHSAQEAAAYALAAQEAAESVETATEMETKEYLEID